MGIFNFGFFFVSWILYVDIVFVGVLEIIIYEVVIRDIGFCVYTVFKEGGF